MAEKKSIFDLSDKFQLDSPLGNWMGNRNEQLEQERRLRKIFRQLKPASSLTNEECAVHGLFVSTIDEKATVFKQLEYKLIPAFGVKLPPRLWECQDYFAPNQTLEYMELTDHLVQEGAEAIKVLKKEDYYFVVKGESFDLAGNSRGVKELKVHSDYIVLDHQMKFYFELDQLSKKINKDKEGKISIERRAKAYYDRIVGDKKLKLIFDPVDMNGNVDRLYIGGGSVKTQAEITLDEYNIENSAAFEAIPERSNEIYQKIVSGEGIEDVNPDSPVKPGILFRNILIHFPLYEILGKGIPGNEVATADEGFQAPYPHFMYLNMLENVLAHETIHAHQNLIDAKNQGDREIGRLVESDAVRGWKRELLAYHFSIFPNKEYSNPINDPVLKYTKFVRGKSAIFGNLREGSIAFFVWFVTRYIIQLQNNKEAMPSGELTDDLNKCIKDIVELRDCFSKKGYKFFKGNGYEFKDFGWFQKVNEGMFNEKLDQFYKTHIQIEEEGKEKQDIKKAVGSVTDDTSAVDFDDQHYIDNRAIIDQNLLDMKEDVGELIQAFIVSNNSMLT